MNPSEVAQLLTFASGVDNRSITADVATIWAQSLDPDILLGDACRAVAKHYGEGSRWVMPSDINTIVKEMYHKPRRDLSALIPPHELADTPPLESAWKARVGAWLDQGLGDQDAREAANREFEITEDEPREIGAGKERMESILADAAKTRSFQEHERAEQRAERKRQSDARAKRRTEIEDGEVAR